MKNPTRNRLRQTLAFGLALAAPPLLMADETCNSPYMKRLTGQEDFMYVWTLGVTGVGD